MKKTDNEMKKKEEREMKKKNTGIRKSRNEKKNGNEVRVGVQRWERKLQDTEQVRRTGEIELDKERINEEIRKG